MLHSTDIACFSYINFCQNMKRCLLFIAIALVNTVMAQIPVRYFTLPPEGEALQMEYRTWERVKIDHQKIAETPGVPMDRMVVNFDNGRPVRMEGFRPEESDVAPYIRVVLLYNDEGRLTEVREFGRRNRRGNKDLVLERISRPKWENDRLVSEEVSASDGKLIQKFLYEAPAAFNGSPLIVCDMFNAGSEGNTSPVGRTGVQYKGKMRHFQFITNEKKDTVFSLRHLRDTPDGYESQLLMANGSGASDTRLFHNQLKYDARGNISQHLSWDEKHPTNGVLIQYRYRYQGDPEWNIPPSTHNLVPDSLCRQAYWINRDQNAGLKFMRTGAAEGTWRCHSLHPQEKGPSSHWLDFLRKKSHGEWRWLEETKQFAISYQGNSYTMLSGRISRDTVYLSVLSDSGEMPFSAAPIIAPEVVLTEEFVVESPPVQDVKAMQEAVEMQSPMPPPPPPSDDEVHHIVEKRPSFPGGDAAMLKLLMEEVKYPALAKEAGISGRVILSFIVEKDGSLSDVQIVRDIGGGCGKAAVDAVKKMPLWIPGQHRGVPVRVKYTLPVIVEYR